MCFCCCCLPFFLLQTLHSFSVFLSASSLPFYRVTFSHHREQISKQKQVMRRKNSLAHRVWGGGGILPRQQPCVRDATDEFVTVKASGLYSSNLSGPRNSIKPRRKVLFSLYLARDSTRRCPPPVKGVFPTSLLPFWKLPQSFYCVSPSNSQFNSTMTVMINCHTVRYLIVNRGVCRAVRFTRYIFVHHIGTSNTILPVGETYRHILYSIPPLSVVTQSLSHRLQHLIVVHI